MKAVMALLGVALVFLMLGGIMSGIEAFRGETYSEPHNVTTDESTESTNIVLALPVLDATVANITVSSSDTDDAPVPFAYATATRQVTVNGLAVSTTRTLTIEYQIQRQEDAADVGAKFLPAFLIIAGIGCVGGAIYVAVKH